MHDLKAKLSSWFDRGLWPFTPDPIEPHICFSNSTVAEDPLWITGNSRHEISSLTSLARGAPVGFAVIDSGGRPLWEAASSGEVYYDDLIASLDEVLADSSGIALLPYPVWQLLGEEDRYTPGGSAVLAGPADISDLAAFGNGEEVREDWQRFRVDRCEVLHFYFAHSLLIALFLFLILTLFFKGQALIPGLSVVLVSCAIAAVSCLLLQRLAMFPRTVACGLAAAGSAYLLQVEIFDAGNAWFSGWLCGLLLAVWLGYLASRLRGLGSPGFPILRGTNGQTPPNLPN